MVDAALKKSDKWGSRQLFPNANYVSNNDKSARRNGLGRFSFGGSSMPRCICVAAGGEDLAIEGLPHCEFHEAQRREKIKRSISHARLSVEALAQRKLYSSASWIAASKAFLRANPLCVDCLELGAVVEATDVDQIERHLGDRVKFFDRSNWQALCKLCHSRKTAKEVFHGG